MASFIARMFGGGKKEGSQAPAPSAPKPKPVTAPAALAREKTASRYAGGMKSKETEEAKIAKKMLLGQ